MRVVATNRGYAKKVYEPGEEFDMPEGSTASWFVPVEESAPTPKPAAKSAGKFGKAKNDDSDLA